jgi:ATP-dependent RNA helicase DDX24/MAK5
LDEADRMTQDHCFPQLVEILDALHQANPREDDEDPQDLLADESEDDDDGDRMRGLPGIRGEASLMMLNADILQQIQDQKASPDPDTREVDDQEFRTGHDFAEEQEDDPVAGDDDAVMDESPKVHRQTFIYSATLTLPYTKTSKPTTKRKKKANGLDGGIAEILEKTQAMGETKVVDLSSSMTSNGVHSTKVGVRLPPGLTLEQIKCTQRHKDSHLFAYLMTTTQGASGPCLVFCNSIAGVRRVGTTLQTLGLSVRMLHANMQQVRFDFLPSRACLVALTKN